jgi:hypothetical protein
MRYVLAPACLAALTLVYSTHAHAGESAVARGVRKGYASVKRDFLRNNYWPEPFNYPDRDAVCAPFAVMVHNGWRLQNTFGAHHFRPGTSELTEAGELKLKWVMTEAPPQQRTVYVERGETADMTAGRIKAVEAAAGRLTVDGGVPMVVETSIQSRGWPADQIDATTRQWLNSVPAPRLPSSTTSTSGGGSN